MLEDLADRVEHGEILARRPTARDACLARFVRLLAPVAAELVAGLADGGVVAHRPYLVWSLTHMFTNRMGVQPPAEAILRYMAYRRHRDEPAPENPAP